MWDRKRAAAIVLCVILCVSSYGAVGAPAKVLAETTADAAAAQDEKAAPAVVEGSLLVTFEEDVTEKKAEDAAEKVDGALAGVVDGMPELAVVEIDEDEDAHRAMRKLERLPQVEAVQQNYIYYTDEDESEDEDEELEEPGDSGGLAASEYDMWHMEYMRVQEAWDLIDVIKPMGTRTEKDRIKVATLDTGIWNHADLQANVDWKNCVTVIDSEQNSRFLYGTALSASETFESSEGVETPDGSETPEGSAEPEEPEPPWMSENLEFSRYSQPAARHGTGMAGLIAATSYNGIGTAGVAAGNHNDLIDLMGIKVFRNGGYAGQPSATTVDIVMGLRYACQKDARVINMCLGHEPGAMDGSGGYHDDELLKAEIDRAVTEDDVVIVCSAGNKRDTQTWYPSDFSNVVSVINTKAYTDVWSSDVRSSTSSYGPKKDVSAPGAGVYTTKQTREYKKSRGTSCAAANAAGVAALVRYANPELTAAEVKEILYSTATDLYEDGYDIYTGHGNLNAYRAVAQAAGVKLPKNRERLDKDAAMTITRSVGPRTIEVNWEADRSTAGYYLYRSTSKDGKYRKIAHIPDKRTTSYKDSGRFFNRKYYYRIAVLGTSQSTKEKIRSEMSRPISGKAVTEIPAFSISRADSHSLKISWRKAAGADGYRIYRAAAEDGTYKKVKTITGGRAAGWTDSNCTPGKEYYYKLRAYKESRRDKVWGTTSEYAYKMAKPVQVKAFKAVRKGKKGKRAKLSWRKDATVSGYEIYGAVSYSGDWKKIKNIRKNTTGTYITKKLKKGQVYSYKIRSYVIVKGEKVYGAYSPVKRVIR